MAFNLLETNGQIQYGVNVFAIDSPDDLANLPRTSKMGSAALCLDDDEIKVYMKNSKGEWKEI